MDRKAALKARWLRRGLIAAIALNALWLVLIGAVFAVPLPERSSDWSVAVEYRDGQPAYIFLTHDEKWRLPVTLDRVDPKYTAALIALEDKRFYSHVGVDPIAITRAAWTDIIARRRVSGGSTISMQLARLLEPRPRTIASKLIEMFRAMQLDARLSKREILENYLSRTPFGRNLEGIESAAWSYFGHGAQHLSPLEIATLLAVPQGPARYSPTKQNAERLRERRDTILKKLIDAGVFSADDTAAAIAEAAAVAPPTKMRQMPRNAAHAAVWLRDLSPGQVRIRSTLEPGAQALAERVVALHAPELQRKHIYNGAVVVVDHRTREIVGLVGNLDFTDFKHGGQIAMFKRARSPGSTLKPLLYSLAIDRGIALPDYLVADVPVEYGTYRPHNFDGDFMGLVTLRDSLARSLNVPFVELLQKLGVEPFISELQRSGVAPTRAKHGEYGLSLIAGGIELTPLEIASLYATLAENGTYVPLRLVFPEGRSESVPLHLGTDKPGHPQAIYGAPAAWLTKEALSLRDRPDFPKRRDILRGIPPEIHWKTGTSFGYRDAWSVGSGPAYTVAVWTGNVDQKASYELVGSEAAGPLLFDVLEGLADRTRSAVPPSAPADLIEIEVCAYSGHIPTDACTHRVKTRAPLHSVPTEPCPYHQVCRAEGKQPESYVALPSSVTAWLVERNRAVPEVPKACAATDIGAPIMMMPTEGQVITLIPGVPAANQVVPLQVSTRAGTVTWFVDGELVGTAAASERMYWTPTVGKHDVVVSDEAGRKARRKLVVQMGASQLR
ncbi:MAG TPA: penicillin-binding protein 1C [Kofleriaceae bacterium]|nr:penicillin-binding protein 1C [Kofleriaceae bacterium]